MWGKLAAIFGDAPVLFFAVVIGVALTFRVTVGWVRDAQTPPVVAPTFATGSDVKLEADRDAKPMPSPTVSPTTTATTTLNAEVGAAASVQPIGSPRPVRVAPKPRGHGRRPAIRE